MLGHGNTTLKRFSQTPRHLAGFQPTATQVRAEKYIGKDRNRCCFPQTLSAGLKVLKLLDGGKNTNPSAMERETDPTSLNYIIENYGQICDIWKHIGQICQIRGEKPEFFAPNLDCGSKE